jgi:GTP cyclohydrolase II
MGGPQMGGPQMGGKFGGERRGQIAGTVVSVAGDKLTLSELNVLIRDYYTQQNPQTQKRDQKLREDATMGLSTLRKNVVIQILKDLGLRQIRLLTNNPKKTDAFIYGGFDLEVIDQVPILPPIHEFNERYLATKREKLGHKFPE